MTYKSNLQSNLLYFATHSSIVLYLYPCVFCDTLVHCSIPVSLWILPHTRPLFYPCIPLYFATHLFIVLYLYPCVFCTHSSNFISVSLFILRHTGPLFYPCISVYFVTHSTIIISMQSCVFFDTLVHCSITEFLCILPHTRHYLIGYSSKLTKSKQFNQQVWTYL